MFRRPTRASLALAALGLLWPMALSAATFKGRPVDDHWFDGHAVNNTYGAYDCRIQFHGDRMFLQLGGVQVVTLLDEEVILDPHEVVGHDPRRGVDWTVDVYNMGN